MTPAYISHGIWLVLLFAAFTFKVAWCLWAIQATLWFLVVLSVTVIIAALSMRGETEPYLKSPLPYRLSTWWCPATAVISTSLMWYLSGGIWWMVGMYLFQKAVLSLNYTHVLGIKDKDYTERMKKEPFTGFADNINTMLRKSQKKSGWWDTRN